MKVFSEESALQLSEMLLQNDKDIKTEIEGKIPSVDGLATEQYVDNSIKNVKVDLTGYATETYVNNAIANAQLSGGDTNVDLSGYATKDDLNDYAVKEHTHNEYLTEHQDLSDYVLKSEIPTDYLSSIPEEYVTDTELEAKGYITEHQDISGKADVDHTHTLSEVTDYTAPDLSDYALKTEIPSITGFITETVLNNTLTDYAKSADIVEYDDTELSERIADVETSLTNKADKTAIPDISNFVEKETGKGLFSGSYNDLSDKPIIPSVDGLISEDTLNTTLANYTKTDNLPTELPANGGNSQTVNGHTVETNVPASAVFTDTVYDDTALKSRIQTIEDDYVKKTEIPTTLPASDVYDWAKAETKPEYTADEVGALPNTTVIPSIEGLASEEYVNNAIAEQIGGALNGTY